MRKRRAQERIAEGLAKGLAVNVSPGGGYTPAPGVDRQYAAFSPWFGAVYVSETLARQYAVAGGTYLNEGG